MRDVPGTIRLGTEPEACGHYIMSSALQSGFSRLKRARNEIQACQFKLTFFQGQSFIVVDAGGGTVVRLQDT